MYPNAEFTFNGATYRFKDGSFETKDEMLIKFMKERELFIEKKQTTLKQIVELKEEIKKALEPEVKEEVKEPEKKKYFSK
jgi:hypothetical protein